MSRPLLALLLGIALLAPAWPDRPGADSPAPAAGGCVRELRWQAQREAVLAGRDSYSFEVATPGPALAGLLSNAAVNPEP